MKKIIALSLLATGLAFAQAGIQGGSDGFHQHNAYTLGQWGVYVGTGGDVSNDAWSFSRGGTFTDSKGKLYGFEDWAGSFSGNFNASVGLLSFLDLGAALPLYFEYAHDAKGVTDDNNMKGLSRGDLDLWIKARAPFGNEKSVFALAAMIDAYIPTGENSAGVRPRHAWYLNDGFTHPFSADAFALGTTVAMTFDFSKIGAPIRWNMNGGVVVPFDGDEPVTLTYGTGVNLLVNDALDMFMEFSGEFRVEETSYKRDMLVDPMLLTPGLRFHLPFNIDMAIGLDVAVRTFQNFTFEGEKENKKGREYQIRYVDENGKRYTYGYASSPVYAAVALMSWHLDGKPMNKDEDGDGVSDEIDQCAHTPAGAVVDSVGCPVDKDKDGVFDGLDKCPGTPAGATVDSLGCPSDSDKDGVFDGIDKCPNTKEGANVGINGCEGDFDGDGVEDSFDRCPNTKKGVKVDSTGCALDSDKDGVTDDVDKCPDTPAGVSIDSVGCPTDADKDGVPDYLDKCLNTPAGLPVDSVGCPADADKDGVPDALDKCPNTPAGAQVNADGCEGDFDGDGIPDALDKCPNTKPGVPVDSTGCPMDADKDGVFDDVDKCPNTPAGTTVDSVGCPLDFDKDGVPDNLDKCPNTPEGVTVDSTGCPLDADKDGVADGIDKCPNTEPGISVDSVGCPMDTDKDGVADHLDKCPYTLQGVKIDAQGCPLNRKEDLNKLKQGIQFQTNSTKFTKNSYGTLNDIVSLLNKFQFANLEVQGHTDNVGSAQKNKELSQARAQAVVDYFIKKGVDSSRVRAVGFGSEKPIESNGTKKGRKANRRVELVPFEK